MHKYIHVYTHLQRPGIVYLSLQCAQYLKDNCPRSVQKHSAFRVPLNGRSKHLALNVGTLINQLLGAHAVVNPGDALLDDWALVQVGCHEVRRSADNLDTAVVRLVVRLGALEGRQEAVVNVDNATRHCFAERRAQHLHIPRKDDQLDVVLLDQFQDLGLLGGLRLPRHRQVTEFDAEAGGELGKVGMVGYNQGDFDRQLASFGAEQQIVEAVANFGDHDEHPRLLGHRSNVVCHLIAGCQLVKDGAEMLSRLCGSRAKVHPHKEFFARRI